MNTDTPSPSEPRNVYLFQPGVSHGRGRFVGYYLPYSVGCLWSYANSHPHIREAYRLGEIIFRRERPVDVVNRLVRPRVAAFSGYIWNWRWNLRVARLIKERYPDCVIVFGGPQVPERQNHTLFVDYPFIDIATHAEGEVTFLEILDRVLHMRALTGIPGTSIPGRDRETIASPRRPRMELEKERPASPFLDGTFDALVAANPNVRWHAVLETHRGCPFRCTFCDWGSLIHAKVKRFDLERVKAEIEWLGRNAVDYVFVADANFGIFLDRDELIVDQFIATHAATGSPSAVAATWNKNSSERTLRLAQRLDAAGLSRGITLSVQSMNPATLRAIERDNMRFSDLKQLFAIADKVGLPAVTEMILGLPEETYDSWVDGTCQVLELGNHSALTFYPAELLENAELATQKDRERFGIRTTKLYGWAWEPDSLDEDGIEEVSEVVIGTVTLPPEKYLDALMFSWLILNFHVDGWTQLMARFVRRHSEVAYRPFYESLQQWIISHPETFLGSEYVKMRQSWVEYFETGRQSEHAYRVGRLQVHGYMQIHGTQYLLRQEHERTWADLEAFFVQFEHGLSPELANDLLDFQQAYVTRFGRPFRFSHNASHNFWEFLRTEEPLQAGSFTYDLEVTEPYDQNDMDDFLNKTYFRRRAGFGKMRIVARTPADIGLRVSPQAVVEPPEEQPLLS